jgi:hypothetical protein
VTCLRPDDAPGIAGAVEGWGRRVHDSLGTCSPPAMSVRSVASRLTIETKIPPNLMNSGRGYFGLGTAGHTGRELLGSLGTPGTRKTGHTRLRGHKPWAQLLTSDTKQRENPLFCSVPSQTRLHTVHIYSLTG